MQTDPIFAVFQIAVLIFSVVVHEVAHGYAARALGDPTAEYQGRLTLNPIKHLDLMGSFIVPVLLYFTSGGTMVLGWAKPVPYNPYNLNDQRTGELKVALAGPASNFAIAALLGLAIRLLSGGAEGSALVILLATAVGTNIVLGLFNLIPVPPLDGSKVLYYFLPYRYAHVREWLESFGFILVLLVVFFAWDLMFPLVSLLFKVFTGL